MAKNTLGVSFLEFWPHGLVGLERFLYTEEVEGSNPSAAMEFCTVMCPRVL